MNGLEERYARAEIRDPNADHIELRQCDGEAPAQSPLPSAVTCKRRSRRTQMKSTFLVIYRPGPSWVAGKPAKEQPPKEHGKYLLNLFAKGSMKLAGPFSDDTGAGVVLEATDEAEARAMVADDPAVRSATFLYEIHAWDLVPWENYLKK
jgi:uncharacterized protein